MIKAISKTVSAKCAKSSRPKLIAKIRIVPPTSTSDTTAEACTRTNIKLAVPASLLWIARVDDHVAAAVEVEDLTQQPKTVIPPKQTAKSQVTDIFFAKVRKGAGNKEKIRLRRLQRRGGDAPRLDGGAAPFSWRKRHRSPRVHSPRWKS